MDHHNHIIEMQQDQIPQRESERKSSGQDISNSPCRLCCDVAGEGRGLIKSCPDMVETAEDGCQFCALFCAIWEHDDNKDWRDHYRGKKNRISLRWTVNGPVYIQFFYPFKDGPPILDGEGSRAYRITNPSGFGFPDWPSLGFSTGLNHSSAASETWIEFVKRSIEDCVGHKKDHHVKIVVDGQKSSGSPSQDCTDENERKLKSSDESYSPTRLIEIENNCQSIRLIETKDTKQSQGQNYAALSHSWGVSSAGSRFRTTKDNKDKMKNSIDQAQLPATFQDAVAVCRAVGIKYLWIDTFCIIQNDKADWDRESVKMCDYYGNAYITISGTCSPDSAVPFLRDSDSKRSCSFNPVEFPFMGRKVLVQRLTAAESEQRIRNKPRANPKSQDAIDPTKPLLSRAWVFQENSLSTRVIHFSNEEVLFECTHGLTSERCTDPPRGTRTIFDRIERWLNRTEDPYRRWQRCVESYFPLRLTQGTDRLPALSGLAESKFKQIRDAPVEGGATASREEPHYLAGLWKQNLARDLLWRLNGTDGIASNEFVAPSWSWASLQGESIHFMASSKSFRSLITFVGVSPAFAFSKFGKVKEGAYITVSAEAKDTNLVCAVSEVDPLKCRYTLPSLDTAQTKLYVCVDTEQGTELLGTKGSMGNWATSQISQPVTVIVVGEENGMLHGLILRRKSGPSSSWYTRIGYFSMGMVHWNIRDGKLKRSETDKKLDDDETERTLRKCKDTFALGSKLHTFRFY